MMDAALFEYPRGATSSSDEADEPPGGGEREDAESSREDGDEEPADGQVDGWRDDMPADAQSALNWFAPEPKKKKGV